MHQSSPAWTLGTRCTRTLSQHLSELISEIPRPSDGEMLL